MRRELGSTCGPAGAHLSTSLEAVLEGPVDSHRLETAPRPSASLFLPATKAPKNVGAGRGFADSRIYEGQSELPVRMVLAAGGPGRVCGWNRAADLLSA